MVVPNATSFRLPTLECIAPQVKRFQIQIALDACRTSGVTIPDLPSAHQFLSPLRAGSILFIPGIFGVRIRRKRFHSVMSIRHRAAGIG